ncbi:MAG: GGDEF domain-containing protein [Pseudohongiella sp.]|nr:GGDEF domain-containing protein [Pseudohongiella sp.]
MANRRRFDEVFATEWARSTRNGSALAIIMLDVDHFKLFNDRYGHQAGDNCLRKLAEVLKQHVGRATDLAARYGGEEFCIISTDADLSGVLVLAERIRANIQAIAIKHEDSSVGVVTVSIGVASMVPSLNHESAELLLAADHALYRAKASGRNCVKSA